MNQKKRLDLAEKNNFVSSLIDLIDAHSDFLLAGHTNPDEDCISSLAALGLLLKKFRKNAAILLPGTIPQKVNYLVDICAYNRIAIYKTLPTAYKTDVVFVLDTPKPSMIDGDSIFDSLMKSSDVIKAEIDHHTGADTDYCGDKPYRLVTVASSTSELIGYLSMHIWMKKQLLKKYNMTELLSRNIVLSILTGISGDAKNGLAISDEEDMNSYITVSRFFEELLHKKTHKNSNNYATLTDIYDVIKSFSNTEHILYKRLIDCAKQFPNCNCLILSKNDVETLTKNLDDYSIFVDVIKSVTDSLAEQTKRIGITAYWDRKDQSDMVQIKVRCAKSFQNIDLREIISTLDIKNGGGHPGAIAVRYPKSEVTNLDSLVAKIREAAVSLVASSFQKTQE